MQSKENNTRYLHSMNEQAKSLTQLATILNERPLHSLSLRPSKQACFYSWPCLQFWGWGYVLGLVNLPSVCACICKQGWGRGAELNLIQQYNQGKQSRMSMRQQPCPYRIVDDFGNGFSLGCAGGIVFYFLRGMWYAPKKEKFMGGITLLKKRAPVLGGNFAIWAGLFSATDCALIGLRKKEDSYNQIAAGAVTGGLLAFRSGARVAMKNAVFGGMMLGCIVIVEKVMMKMHKREELQMQKDMTEKHNREQRRMIAKARPDLFQGSGDNLIPRSRSRVERPPL